MSRSPNIRVIGMCPYSQAVDLVFQRLSHNLKLSIYTIKTKGRLAKTLDEYELWKNTF